MLIKQNGLKRGKMILTTVASTFKDMPKRKICPEILMSIHQLSIYAVLWVIHHSDFTSFSLFKNVRITGSF